MSIPNEQMPGLIERMVRIDTKLDVFITQQTDHEGRIRTLETDNTPGGHQDHETRIRRLERTMWLACGLAAAVGAGGGAVVGPMLGG